MCFNYLVLIFALVKTKAAPVGSSDENVCLPKTLLKNERHNCPYKKIVGVKKKTVEMHFSQTFDI